MSMKIEGEGERWDEPGDTAIVETILAIKPDHEPPAHIVSGTSHNCGKAVFESHASPDLDIALARDFAHGRLTAEVDDFPTIITLVLWSGWIVRGHAGVVPGCCSGVVVDEIDPSRGSHAHLPS